MSYPFDSLLHLDNDEILKHIECLRYNQIEIPFQMKVNVYFYYV